MKARKFTPEEVDMMHGAAFRSALRNVNAPTEPAPETTLAYMSGTGVLFERTGDYLIMPTRRISGSGMSVSEAAEQYGPLIELVAIGSFEAVRQPDEPAEPVSWSTAVRYPSGFDHLGRPEPFGAFGFEGKRLACFRRTLQGPWCEWTMSTVRMSLAVVIEEAAKHGETMHDG